MADPVVWQDLPMSQSDSTTIAEYIAAQIAAHNADPDAHLADGGSLQMHKSAEVVDALAGSIVPDKLDYNIQLMGTVTGSVPPILGRLQQTGIPVSVVYTNAVFTSIVGGLFIVQGSDDHFYYSVDGATWTDNGTMPPGGLSHAVTGLGALCCYNYASGTLSVEISSDATNFAGHTVNVTTSNYFVYGFDDVIVLCDRSTTPNKFYTSTNGYTFTFVANAPTGALGGLIRDEGGAYVAYFGTYDFYESNDLSSWDYLSSPPVMWLSGFTYRNGLYCFSARPPDNDDWAVYTSTTATGWTPQQISTYAEGGIAGSTQRGLYYYKQGADINKLMLSANGQNFSSIFEDTAATTPWIIGGDIDGYRIDIFTQLGSDASDIYYYAKPLAT